MFRKEQVVHLQATDQYPAEQLVAKISVYEFSFPDYYFMIKIYDTMSRDLREFVPIEDGKVKMYVCGPTVYNYIHVGNARSTVAFDTIRRYFEYRGYEVAYISNFTDVDDKIINRAKEEGITPQEVADKYIAAFREDVTAFGRETCDSSSACCGVYGGYHPLCRRFD